MEKKESKNQLIRGFIFACTQKTEAQCFERMLLGTRKHYGPIVIRIRKGDLLFLNNLETNILYGIFKAISPGSFNIEPDAWDGKYPYQVKVEILGERIITLKNAKKIIDRFGLKRNIPLFGKKLIDFIDRFVSYPALLGEASESLDNESFRLILEEKEKIRKRINEIDIEEEIPLPEATTFWDFPKQSYGLPPKGDNKYPGVTPALIIFNMVWRYTNIGDLVVDPMAGSGTTFDVCKAEARRCICFDIVPTCSKVIQGDARKIPLKSNSADMIFIDSPFGDNIKYNEHPEDIGKISVETEQFYEELEKIMKESYRVLKENKVLGWLIGDQWVKRRFTPVGFKVYERLCRYFEPLDIICIARRGQTSHTGLWFNRARRVGFFLRGFKYLILVRKPSKVPQKAKAREVKWIHYAR